jgi:flagellar biosynthesis protein FlhB
MAGDDMEKSELATSRRLEDLSAKGQFPYSRELAGALLLFLIAGALKVSGDSIGMPMMRLFQHCFSLESAADITFGAVPGLFWQLGRVVLGIVGPLLLLAFSIVLVAGYLQVGVSFNGQRLQWRWERLNPIAGARKLCNIRSALPLLMSLAKLTAVGWIAWTTIKSVVQRSPELLQVELGPLSNMITDASLSMAFRVGIFLLVIGLIDVFWQRFTFMKDTMMSKHEVKEESKQAEGDPHTKSRIKQRQREIARAKMLRDVRKAAVVIRNPTHFAVALKYERGVDAAPKCVAKGQDHIALRIIAEAEKHKVPVVSKPELARELHRVVKVGSTIPEALYKTVAAVLAFVLRRKQARAEA